ncbi:V-type ATPase subunit [Bacillota bacterium Meth-B3]
MPQLSYGFAIGRVQVLSKSLLSGAAIGRLLSLDTIEDVARALTELNWGDVRGARDIEQAAEHHVQAAAALVRDTSPDAAATDCFLVRYDALNLKLLVKARALGQLDGLPLSPNGLIDAQRLRRAVEERRYAELPDEFLDAMERIEGRIAVKMDPLFVDAELDKAAQRFINRRIEDTNDAVIRAYFAERTCMLNLLIALRSHAIGRDGAFAREMLLPGGTLDEDALAQVADAPERAAALISGKPYAGALAATLKRTPVDLAEVEKAVDDRLAGLLSGHKNETLTIRPLVGYLLAREREAGAVRLIATAKAANVPITTIERRLRAMY